MMVRTDEARAGCEPSAAMWPAGASGVSAIPASWEFTLALNPRLRLVPLPAVPGVRGAGARFERAALSGTLAPRGLPFADMPDVTCCLLMASQAVLLSIMSHGRHVQTGVPITHLYPE